MAWNLLIYWVLMKFANGFSDDGEKVNQAMHYFGGQLTVVNWYHQVFNISGSIEYTLRGTKALAGFGHTGDHNKPSDARRPHQGQVGAIF
jgi:hypothetical protein